MTDAALMQVPTVAQSEELVRLVAAIREICAKSPLDIEDRRTAAIVAGLAYFLEEFRTPQVAAIAAHRWLEAEAADLVTLTLLIRAWENLQ